jgi:hypothetical protein
MAVQRKHATTVRLTRRTYDALLQRAQRAGRDADALADEMLQKAMTEMQPTQPLAGESERDMYRRILRDRGIVLRDAAEYQTDLDPNADYDAMARELASVHLDPPLSQTIVEERHGR